MYSRQGVQDGRSPTKKLWLCVSTAPILACALLSTPQNVSTKIVCADEAPASLEDARRKRLRAHRAGKCRRATMQVKTVQFRISGFH